MVNQCAHVASRFVFALVLDLEQFGFLMGLFQVDHCASERACVLCVCGVCVNEVFFLGVYKCNCVEIVL